MHGFVYSSSYVVVVDEIILPVTVSAGSAGTELKDIEEVYSIAGNRTVKYIY